jgi:hypothetical protein
MFFFQFSVDLSLFLRISTISIILLSLLCPSTCYVSSVSNTRGQQSNSTDIAVSTSRSTRATDSHSRAPLVSHSTSTPSSWTVSTLSRKHRESNNGRTTSTSIHNKSTTNHRAYTSSPLTTRGTTSTHRTHIPLPSTTGGITSTRSTTTASTSTVTSSTRGGGGGGGGDTPSSPPPASPPPAFLPPTTPPTTSPRSTTSTLTSITSTSSTELCSYSSDCGGLLYSLEEARSLPELALPALFKREMRGPENYGGDVTTFFLTELLNARASGQLLNYRTTSAAAKLRYFRDQDLTTGVLGLFGCTSIIVISKGAVWVSHWWENPVFISQSFREFRD